MNVNVWVAQSRPTLCDLMDCSPLGSSDHEVLQARIVEWVAMPSSRGSSQPRNRTQVSRIAGRYFTVWATWEAHQCLTLVRSPEDTCFYWIMCIKTNKLNNLSKVIQLARNYHEDSEIFRLCISTETMFSKRSSEGWNCSHHYIECLFKSWLFLGHHHLPWQMLRVWITLLLETSIIPHVTTQSQSLLIKVRQMYVVSCKIVFNNRHAIVEKPGAIL